ncbi:MAG: hypothetical protein U0768_06515 [Anaerolineae bacterium]
MEIVVGASAGILILCILISVTAAFAHVGRLTWDDAVSRVAKTIWSSLFVGVLLVLYMLFGSAIFRQGWAAFIVPPVVAFGLFWGLDLIVEARRKDAPPPPPNHDPDWDALWKSYEGRALPPAMAEAAQTGRVVYGGRVAIVEDGILVPRGGLPKKGIEKIFGALDRVVGPKRR